MSSSRRIGPPKNQRPQALRVPGLNKAFLPHQQKVAPGGPTDRRPARHGQIPHARRRPGQKAPGVSLYSSIVFSSILCRSTCFCG
ncbi:hypothetical protein LR48_Vigan01g254800 [Vigna angularis]|uniref:Uncharacterized protein n=1 Tax=Phaseolus angularis TaxID=3914 RepID=A0A0L9TRF3_PHAAN|nr:hypothetical protein LR48_Vigan01g254800 [Vigna angularis]